MIIYTVKPNDTLYSIAQNYGTTSQSLAEVNGIPIDMVLVVGQNIIIPSQSPEKIGTMAVNGYCYPSIERNLLYKALPYLTYISIFSYGFTQNGELIPTDDEEVIAIARQFGVAPVMVLTTLTETGNFNSDLATSLFQNPNTQSTLISNIITTLSEKNYYALDIDFEFIRPEDEDLFINFLAQVKDALAQNNFILFVSLAPKNSPDQKGLLYEAHNYRRVGEIADLSLLMTYEWGYTYDCIRCMINFNYLYQKNRQVDLSTCHSFFTPKSVDFK